MPNPKISSHHQTVASQSHPHAPPSVLAGQKTRRASKGLAPSRHHAHHPSYDGARTNGDSAKANSTKTHGAKTNGKGFFAVRILRQLFKRKAKMSAPRVSQTQTSSHASAQSASAPKNHLLRRSFRSIRHAVWTKKDAPTPQQIKKLKDFVSTDKQLARLMDAPQVAKRVEQLKEADLSKLKDAAGIFLLSKIIDHVGKERSQEIYQKIISGEKAEALIPSFIWASELETLNDVGDFLSTLEPTYHHMAELAQKLEKGEATHQERKIFGELLRQTQNNLAIAQTHLGHSMSSHLQKANKEKVSAELGLLIPLKAYAERLATHHMACADLLSRYGASLELPAIPMSAGKIKSHLLEASAWLRALSHQKEATQDEDEKKQLDRAIGQLQTHIHNKRHIFAVHKEALLGRDDMKNRLAEKIYRTEDFAFHFDLDLKYHPSAQALQKARDEANAKADWPAIEHFLSLHRDGVAYNYASETKPAGASFGPYLAPPYHHGVSADERANHHAPNLAHSVVRDLQSQQIIYSAIRHAGLAPKNINADFLLKSDRKELQEVLGLYWVDHQAEMKKRDIHSLNQLIFEIQTQWSQKQVEDLCGDINHSLSLNMAREVVASSLLADPEKYEQALQFASFDENYDETKNKGVVPVTVNMMSLMNVNDKHSSERQILNNQTKALKEISQNGKPFHLPILSPSGDLCFVPIKVVLRQINFEPEPIPPSKLESLLARFLPASLLRHIEGFRLAPNDNDSVLTDLLGKRREDGLGGAVASRLKQIDDYKNTLLARMEVISDNGLKQNSLRGEEVFQKIKQEVVELEKKEARLRLLAQDVKGIWQSGALRPSSRPQILEPHQWVARLAALYGAMDEVPILSDANGLDRVNRCDAEAKYLIACEASGDALLPIEQMASQDNYMSERALFALRSGGVELNHYQRNEW